MRGKGRLEFFCSVFIILTLVSTSLCSVQGIQAIQAKVKTPQLVPSSPSSPYWSFRGSDWVQTVAVSQDGSTVVAGYFDGWLYVFGRQSNATLWRYKFGDVVISVAVSADGSTIVAGAGGGDRILRVFGRQSNATIWSYRATGSFRAVAVSADGSIIVAGCDDGRIRVFGRASNATIWNYIIPGYYIVWSVSVSDDGNTIAAGANDGSIRVFGRSSNALVWSYLAPGTIYGVTVSRDGTTIAAGDSSYGILRAFGRASNTTLVKFDTGAPVEDAVAISSDGSTIACGNLGGTTNSKAYLVSKTLGLLWGYVVQNSIGGSPGVAISGDGTLAAYGSIDHTVYVVQYDRVAPVLGTPSVSPPAPVGGQSITISVSATDSLGVSTVTLHYWSVAAGSWSFLAMSLAGAAYRATIGPFSSGDIVSYYISATDTSGNNASTPLDAPLAYYTFAIGSGALLSESVINILIGVGLGAVIVIVASLVMTRGKKSRR